MQLVNANIMSAETLYITYIHIVTQLLMTKKKKKKKKKTELYHFCIDGRQTYVCIDKP